MDKNPLATKEMLPPKGNTSASKLNSKPISTPQQSEKLDHAFNEILKKRMARNSNQIIEIADTNLGSGIK